MTTLNSIDLDHLPVPEPSLQVSLCVLDLIFARIIFAGMLDSLLREMMKSARDFFFHTENRGVVPLHQTGQKFGR